ncbi:MAG: class I SAM-dependent methyltransferase [Nitrospirae bacterium]|nr:class I SAM-dependent methyltransferase [Nitrospirota bacterium]
MREQVIGSNSIDFWNKNAKWYELWLEHNQYHRSIITLLNSFVKPGWRVLDIGAGSGVLSLPLAEKGCVVTALEPSEAMRMLLEKEISSKRIESIIIDSRSWEDIPLNEIKKYDLVIASNSLHLTFYGFITALKKIFLSEPGNVFVVSEKQFIDCALGDNFNGYSLFLSSKYSVESSYVYHCFEEAFDHWSFKNQRIPDKKDKDYILSDLVYENGHIWKKGTADVCVYHWGKINTFDNFIHENPREVNNEFRSDSFYSTIY